MMFYMSSKTLQNVFLVNEKDKDILKAQYVLVSTRVRKRGEYENIVSATNILFPSSSVCSAITLDDLRDRYFKQLDESTAFIAALIKGSIEENYNIIFLCSKREMKLKYLQFLSEYIYIKFGYPVYDYNNYALGISKILKYNKKEVMHLCNGILNDAKNKQMMKDLNSERGRQKILKDYKKKDKSELKKILKNHGLYSKGMSKSEMIDTIEVFM